MPQPIRNPAGLSARGDPRVILERPTLAALVGAIAAEWAAIDDILEDIFNVASLAKPIPVGAHSKDPIATAIFDILISLPARIEIIQSVLVLRVLPELQEEFLEVAKFLRQRIKDRNQVVHKSWHVCDAYPDDLITFDVDGKWIRYTERDFSDALERSVEARNRANDYYIRLAGAPKTDLSSL